MAPPPEVSIEPNACASNLKEPLLPIERQPEHETGAHGSSSLEEPFLSSSEQTQEADSLTPLWDGLPRKTAILLKSLYFLEGLGASTWGRFAVIYFNLHGLSPEQVGLLGGLMPAARTVSQPLWGVVADVLGTRKQVYLLCRVAGTSVLLTMALPIVYQNVWRIFAVSILTVVFSSSLGILDAYTLELLGEQNKTMYGRYRLWCALSWGAGAVAMGFLTDRYGFEFNFILYGTLGYVSCILIAAFVPDQRTEGEGGETVERGSAIDLARLLLRPRVVVFCLELIIMGAAMGTVERLLFLYLINDLGASTLLCGLSVGVTVLLELPIFWGAGSLLRWLGHDGLAALSMVCFVVRTYGYTLLTPESVTWVLCLEMLHGITFACFWVAVMDITKTLSEQTTGWNTTIPVVTNTLFSCFGWGLGSIIGGWAMETYGSKAMYRGVSRIIFLALVVHLLGSLMARICCSKRNFLPGVAEGASRREERVGDEDNASEESETDD